MGSWAYFDPEYETLNIRINPPQASGDNSSCKDCTLVKEYYIRHMDGRTLDIEGEKVMVIKCLEAAICRRTSEGLRLEICAKDRVGLLSEVTRVLRENGLSVTRAGVSTVGEEAMNVFYVNDASGNPVDAKTSYFFGSLLEKFRS